MITSLLGLTWAAPLLYLDPGTGSYLLQLVVAGLLGLGFVLKVFWGRIKAFFTRPFRKDQPKTDDEPGQ